MKRNIIVSKEWRAIISGNDIYTDLLTDEDKERGFIMTEYPAFFGYTEKEAYNKAKEHLDDYIKAGKKKIALNCGLCRNASYDRRGVVDYVKCNKGLNIEMSVEAGCEEIDHIVCDSRFTALLNNLGIKTGGNK